MGPADAPLVVVITVWREEGGVKARIVHGARVATQTQVSGSVADLLHAVADVVDAWQRSGSTPRP